MEATSCAPCRVWRPVGVVCRHLEAQRTEARSWIDLCHFGSHWDAHSLHRLFAMVLEIRRVYDGSRISKRILHRGCLAPPGVPAQCQSRIATRSWCCARVNVVCRSDVRCCSRSIKRKRTATAAVAAVVLAASIKATVINAVFALALF